MEVAPEQTPPSQTQSDNISQGYEQDDGLSFVRIRQHWNDYFASSPPQDLNVVFPL